LQTHRGRKLRQPWPRALVHLKHALELLVKRRLAHRLPLAPALMLLCLQHRVPQPPRKLFLVPSACQIPFLPPYNLERMRECVRANNPLSIPIQRIALPEQDNKQGEYKFPALLRPRGRPERTHLGNFRYHRNNLAKIFQGV